MYRWLERRPALGPYALKTPGPASLDEWFEAMDEALDWTSSAQATGAPAFDHGRMLFERISLSVQRELTHELSRAHRDLQSATNRLKIATWWLLVVTVLLGVVEVVALIRH